MEIIPAIDIRRGRCVRLEQGDYARETVFADDPSVVADRWRKGGARMVHVVDLDGAREGRPVNVESVQRILRGVRVRVQLGGGIRDIATVQRYLHMGADRVVLGTAAVKDQTMLVNAVTLYRQQIVVGVDAREGVVVVEGWLQSSGVPARDLVRQLSELGVSRIVYTDVSRDGTLSGPNFPAIAEIVDFAGTLPAPVSVIASGGVSSLDHVTRLAALGVEGVIIGKALYTGAIDLRQALAVAGQPS